MTALFNEGLEGIIATETAISLVDGERGRLVYRGHWADSLALNASFEEVCYLLWYGKHPNEAELLELTQSMKSQRALPEHAVRILTHLPESLHFMNAMQIVLSSLGTDRFLSKSKVEQAISLTSLLPTIIAYRYRSLRQLELIQPPDHLDHISAFLYMLTGDKPTLPHHKALSAYSILTMEHGMNASTFAARVIASTESDLLSAVSGAIGAMKGPLHGGAPIEVMTMLEQIKNKEQAEAWLTNELECGRKLMGFGHRVYKTIDPRAEALKHIASELTGEEYWLDLAYHVEKTAIRLLQAFKPGRRLYTNVEFYAAAVLKSLNIPAELFTPIFSSSRLVGWTAHILEQASHNRIYRPEALYTGELPESDKQK